MASRSGYKRRWISTARSLVTSAVIPEAKQHLIESDSAGVSEHCETDLETEPPSPKQLRSYDHDSIPPENFDPGFPNSCCNSSSSESTDSGDSDSDANLKTDLIDWVNLYQIKHKAVDSLQKILKESGHDQLPGSATSLIKTARYVPITEKSGMEYIYFPVKEELMRQFLRYPTMMKESVTTLEISLNIEGLPLFKSSNKTLWPVLCGIMNVQPVAIFPVALTYGRSKPTDLLFLQDTVDELNYLLEHGLNVDGKVIPVTLRCIVCDAPARALVKGTKLYSGYFGCDKCAQKGEWIGRIVYPETSLRSRRYSLARDNGKLEIPPAQKLHILSSPAAGCRSILIGQNVDFKFLIDRSIKD